METYEITETRDGMEMKITGGSQEIYDTLVKVMSGGSREHYCEVRRGDKSVSTDFSGVGVFDMWQIRRNKLNGKLTSEDIHALAVVMTCNMLMAVAE